MWDVKEVTNISFLFRECSKIKYLPDISNWNTNRIRDIKEIFLGCTKLESLPDISKWNI
jgi:surface protein